MKGVVLSFFPNGYGFVREVNGPPGQRRDYFYHIANSPDLDVTDIWVGMPIEFEIITSERTGREEATDVKARQF